MTGWTDEARKASAEARRRRAHGRSPAAKTKRRKGSGTVTEIADRIKAQAKNRRSFGSQFTEAAKRGALQSGTPFGNYADYLNRWSHMTANNQGTLSDQYWRRKGVDPAAARAEAARKKKPKVVR